MKRNFRHTMTIVLSLMMILAVMMPMLVSCDTSEWSWNNGLSKKITDSDSDTAESSDGNVESSDGNAEEETVSRVADISYDKDGRLVLTLTDGSTVVLGESSEIAQEPTTIISNSIVIEGSDTLGDTAYAATKALRSAVSIICTYQKTVTTYNYYGWGWGGRSTPSTETQTYYSAGSGVIFKLDQAAGDAYIITNYHVVYDGDCDTEDHISDTINVYLYGSEIVDAAIEAKYIGGSMYYDLAVLKVTSSAAIQQSVCSAVTFGNSDEIAAGQLAMAVGNPEGEGTSVTSGIVSVPSEYITMTGADETTTISFRVIRVDTAVNSGNSGGGLYNAKGELIGIVNAKVSDSSVENIGYAIPSNVVTAVVQNILDYCDGETNKSVMRGMLGITVTSNSSHAVIQETTGLLSIVENVVVAGVSDTGLAYGILQADDILVSIKVGDKVTDITRQYHVIDAMLDARAGTSVEITYVRNGETQTGTFTITEENLVAY